MRVLVTGAAGYIGSVVTQRLIEQGHDVLAVDNLSHGARAAVHPEARFEQGDLLDAAWLMSLLRRETVDAVVHLAAEIAVGESVVDPGLHYRANFVCGIHLLDAMVAADLKRLVFSSTAAVYGEPKSVPITEEASLAPVNPYGQSKLDFERAMGWYAAAHGLRYLAFRYFNACGATDRFGEYRAHETHIIPLLLAVATGHRERFSLYGDDYDTPDGTCVRDYVHVSDIARAHLLGLERIDDIHGRAYNIGNGNGFSNLEVVRAVERVTGRELPVDIAARRPGDAASLVASSRRIQDELDWQAQVPQLDEMIRTAWVWREAHPSGYNA